MTFSEFDAGEMTIGMTVDQMEDELLPYCIHMFKTTFGFKPAVDYQKDRAILRWLRKTYGEDAGRLVKWLFFRYNGKTDGETFSITWFNRGHKWWIDKMYSEMKLATVPQTRPKSEPSGFLSAKDLFRATSSAA